MLRTRRATEAREGIGHVGKWRQLDPQAIRHPHWRSGSYRRVVVHLPRIRWLPERPVSQRYFLVGGLHHRVSVLDKVIFRIRLRRRSTQRKRTHRPRTGGCRSNGPYVHRRALCRLLSGQGDFKLRHHRVQIANASPGMSAPRAARRAGDRAAAQCRRPLSRIGQVRQRRLTPSNRAPMMRAPGRSLRPELF
jgi:hypothetical protein